MNRHPSLAITPLLLAAAAASGATYECGSGQPYATLASLPALSPGDVVHVHSGTYNEVKRWTDAGTAAAPILIQGVGATRPVIDATGLTVDGSLPNPRAVFQVEASYVTIDNFELVNAANGDDGSGIRVTSFGATSVGDVIENCFIHNNDMGIMDDSCDACLIQGCEIAFNGYAGKAGYTHNLYLGGGATTVRACHIHDATQGQNVKSRGHFTALLYNDIEDSQDGEIGLVDDTATATPNSNAVVLGNLIISKPRGSSWNSERFIQWGQDLRGAHTGTIYILHNTCIAGASTINFIWSDEQYANIVASGNIFLGSTEISPNDYGTISGTQNWVPSGADVPAGLTLSVSGSDPGFVDSAGGDYHLASGSSAIGIVAPGETYLDGSGASIPGDPTEQYISLGVLAARATAVDAGAFPAAGGGTSGTTSSSGTTSATGTTGASSSTGSSGTGSTGAVAAGGGSTGGCGLGGGLGLMLGLMAVGRLRRR